MRAVRTPAQPRPLAARAEPAISDRTFALSVAACTAGLAAFLLTHLTTLPPHEDETLALFVGSKSLGGLLSTVIHERGGAPLHFLVAFAVAHTGGGLTALRAASAVFAVASVPLVAVLTSRLTNRIVGLLATLYVSANWIVLFHGIFGRMYSLFLLTSMLSLLAFMSAREHGGKARWTLWAIATLAMLATHAYGALVLAAQGLFVLVTRKRLREAVVAFAVVGVAATPFWWSDVVLAQRFEVEIGAGGDRTGAPVPVLDYLWGTARDFSVGWIVGVIAVLLTAAFGFYRLARARRETAILIGCVVVVPVAMLLVAGASDSASPESRHLVFALPFFAIALITGFAPLLRLRLGAIVVAAIVVALVSGEVAWGRYKTPLLFRGEPHARTAAREAAGEWLARTGRTSDVLYGFNPVFLAAWDDDKGFPRTVIPRADQRLARRLLAARAPAIGRGIWVLDASGEHNDHPSETFPRPLPRAPTGLEERAFGPYLVFRSRDPTRTPLRYFRQAAAVMLLGAHRGIVDAEFNYDVTRDALKELNR